MIFAQQDAMKVNQQQEMFVIFTYVKLKELMRHGCPF